MRSKISVIVCARNEERRLAMALDGIKLNEPDEIIVVDDDSTDATADIARTYTHKVIVSKRGFLSANRQIGIDEARNDLIAMIDADHILGAGDLDSLVGDLRKYGLDMVQSQLVAYASASFWNASEEAAWELVHNIAGPRRMIGASPVVYRKRIFERVRFDGHITKNNDDGDFVYRLSQHKEFKYGIGDTKIRQLHFPSLASYLRKFMWYGHMDGEFVRKHPRRTGAHLFHLLVRYPVIYSARAIGRGKPSAIPFVVLQGTIRFVGLVAYMAKWSAGAVQ